MPKYLRTFVWRQALPRMVADLVLVHCSLLTSLAISTFYIVAVGRGVEAQAIVADFTNYYTRTFLPLSPIFLVVFFACGFYTHTRGYAGKYKLWAIVRGVGIALATFIAAAYLVSGSVAVGRSVALPFVALAGIGLCSVRLLKTALENWYARKTPVLPLLQVEPGRVLVVGGAGYIGSFVVELLLKKGYAVRVLDSLLYGDESLRHVREHPRFELQVGDCRNIQDVVKAVRGASAIIHLAAIVGDPACEQDRESAIETNYAATRMLIEVAKGNGVSRFLFASSCSVYGATDFEVDEKAAVHPISLYGTTKVDSERVLIEARSESFHPVVLRFATVFGYGYRPRFDLVVNLLTAKARQEGIITIFNGTLWRPFIHVRDVAEATVHALESPAATVSGHIFNIGDSRMNYTLRQVAECVQEIFPDTRVEYRVNPDRRNYRVSFEKVHRRLRFEVRYTLRDGIIELKKAFDDGLIGDYTDIRYHNQRFLQAAGAIGHKQELDGLVMAAFAATPNHRVQAAAM